MAETQLSLGEVLAALRGRLSADALLGVKALPVSRELIRVLSQASKGVAARPPAGATTAAASASRAVVAPTLTPPVPQSLLKDVPPAALAGPARRASKPPAAAAQREVRVQEADRAVALRVLDERHVRGCTLCEELASTRTQTVFGVGDPHAKLVFLGEAPGVDEDATGEPFVGRAGQLLTKMIEAMGLTRGQVYICNVLKCRPPNNRPPTDEESACCSPFLMEQLRHVAPPFLVTLGNPATQSLLKTKVGITKLRGTWHEVQIPGVAHVTQVMPTYHPSYLLRQGERTASGKPPEAKRQAWSDLQQVMAAMGLGKG